MLDEKNYLDKIALAISDEAKKRPGVWASQPQFEQFWRSLALICLVKGDDTTDEDVYNGLVLWNQITNRGISSWNSPFSDANESMKADCSLYSGVISDVAESLRSKHAVFVHDEPKRTFDDEDEAYEYDWRLHAELTIDQCSPKPSGVHYTASSRVFLPEELKQSAETQNA